MIDGYILGVTILIGAAALGLVEVALGPDNSRFPCVGPDLVWGARGLTVVLAARGFFILRASYNETLPPVAWDQMLAGAALSGFLVLLLVQIIRQRLPVGVWRRLQARHARVRRLAKAGGPSGAVLARVAADIDPIVVTPGVAMEDSPVSFRRALDGLARLP